jgi:hypothetical protein
MTNAGIIRIAGVGIVFSLAAAGPAEAAKGVKKVAPANNTPRMMTGVVLSVTHQNVSGTFHLRTAQHHRKRGLVNQTGVAGVNGAANQTGVAAGNGAVNQAGVAGGNPLHHMHVLHVTAATRFAHWNGNPASLASLHRGERVRVQATGNQAGAVMILSHHHIQGSFNRYRTNVYRPHLYQHHVIHHRRR